MIDVSGKRVPVIATEEHYVIPEFVDASLSAARRAPNDLDGEDLAFFLGHPLGRPWLDPLSDLGEGRLRVMDEAGIDLAVLSLMSPGVQMQEGANALALARHVNDHLADTVRRHPTRFAGLAVFPPQDPAAAAKEVERAIRQLGLCGLVVNSHTHGEYLDDPKFWPIFEATEALDAPIYIHPRNPPNELRRYMSNSRGEKALAGGVWGFQFETSLHAVRLIVSGVFDRFPKLKIVLGHMGEGLPFWLYRLDDMYERGYRRHGKGAAKRLPSEYFADNFVITISGVHDHPLCHPTLSYCCSVIGTERVLFAADHPFSSAKAAAESLRTAPLAHEDIAKIAHENAERVFHLPSVAMQHAAPRDRAREEQAHT